jgi:tRNA pseudouridine38-40 synthase
MREACRSLRGKQNFAPFTTAAVGLRNTVRTVFEAEVQRKGELVFFNILADSFLPQQVRRMVRALIRVGWGKMTVEEFHELARSKQLRIATLTAPARGLCLMRVNYPHIRFEND